MSMGATGPPTPAFDSRTGNSTPTQASGARLTFAALWDRRVKDAERTGNTSTQRLDEPHAHLAAFFGEAQMVVTITTKRLLEYTDHRRAPSAMLATVNYELAQLRRACNLTRR
jgi:hypothetical protein